MRLILVRHGESVGNAQRRLQGQSDHPLTELGREQSRRLGQRLAKEGVTALYSSPIHRAWQTAEVIGELLGLAPQPLPGVEEYDFGNFSGLTWEEIRAQAPELVEFVRSRRPEYPQYPGEEGREAFRQRVYDALWGLVEAHREGTLAVVTHAGPIIVFVSAVVNRPYVRPVPFRLDNGSLTVVETFEAPEGRRLVLLALNDTCHLRDGV